MDAKELLDRFVNKETSRQDQEEIKRLIKTDPDFKKEFIREKAMQAAITARKKAALKNELKGFLKDVKYEQEETKEKTPPKKAKIIGLQTRRLVMAIAASLTLLLVSYFVLNDQTNYDGLYADNYRVYKYGMSMSRGESGAKIAEETYSSGNYKEAITLFSNALKQPEEQLKEDGFSKNMIQLYIGNAQMNLSEYEKAEKTFKSIINDESASKAFKQDAAWFLSLTYLKLEDKTKAKALLEQLVKEKSSYTRDATDLIEKL